MKKVFKIYPALFILQRNAPVINNSQLRKVKLNSDLKDLSILEGRPQRYRGERVDTGSSVVFMQFTNAVSYSWIINLSETLFDTLKPVTFIGKDYTFTYLSVNN